jgi:hypothetical protein
VRFRAACIALAAVATATLLAGCGGSNVGIAARVGGRQITESQLSSYVTPKARGIALTSASNLTPPKSFVLYILISQELYRDVLREIGGVPSPGRISALMNSYVRNSTPERAVVALGVRGYSPSFAQEVLRYRALGSILSQRARKGADLTTAVRKLHFAPLINPRYGTWDAKHLTIASAPSDGMPDYLHLQPTLGSVAAG